MLGVHWMVDNGLQYCCCSVVKSCPTVCDLMDCSTPGFSVLHHLLEFVQTHVHCVDDVIQTSHPLSPPSPLTFNLSQHWGLFQSIPSQLSLNQVAKVIGASASVLPMNVWGWFPLGLTGLISWQSKGLARVFSNTTVWKHQFFGSQPSLWSNSYICTWLLEKPQPWLYWPLSTQWCLCFLICCLGLSKLFFQGASIF